MSGDGEDRGMMLARRFARRRKFGRMIFGKLTADGKSGRKIPSADFIFSSHLMKEKYPRIILDYNDYLNRDLSKGEL